MLRVAVVERLPVDHVALANREAGGAEHAHLLRLVVVERRLPVERVEVKDPIGLPESERPEDDRLGLDSARRHVSSVISRREGDRDVRPGRTQAAGLTNAASQTSIEACLSSRAPRSPAQRQ